MAKAKAVKTKRVKMSLRDFKELERFYDIKETKFKLDYIKRKNGDIWVNPWIVHSFDGEVTARLVPMLRLAPGGDLRDLYKIQITFSISVNETQLRDYIKDIDKLFRRTHVSPTFIRGKLEELGWDKRFKAPHGTYTTTKNDIKRRNEWIIKRNEELKNEIRINTHYKREFMIIDELRKMDFGNAEVDLSFDAIRGIIQRK
ncbi:hypothetical protein KKB18_11595 [bacterium]|nr:hypothetical protein [bacterium]